LILDEHTVPKDNLEALRLADGGGMPGGVIGRCRPVILMMIAIERMIIILFVVVVVVL
jgi:hypothetical protein